MIKIKLYESEKHRNECTFRPFLYAHNSIREIGIEFTTGDSYDYAWIAQASFINKKVSLEQSINDGLEFLSKISGDYMLIDGQDSTSLIGAYEVFKESNALLLLKNSLLKDRTLYKQGWQLGRYYWGSGDYKLEDFDMYSDRIVLSGTNWLMTHWAGIQPKWYQLEKQYDISAMFQYPTKEMVYEHGHEQSIHYDRNRKNVIDIINQLPFNVAKLANGERVSIDEYYNRIMASRIMLAPYGYGEMTIRDLDAAMFGAILIKPDMSYIDTIPNIYIPDETYITCKHDFSDLREKIELILGNYKDYQYIIENARKTFLDKMHPHYLAIHLHNIFKNLTQISI
jgi:hypothetical protein